MILIFLQRDKMNATKFRVYLKCIMGGIFLTITSPEEMTEVLKTATTLFNTDFTFP